MSIFFKSVFSFLLFAIIFGACTSKPKFPDEPHLEFVSLSKIEVNQLDTLWVKLNFKDGDGNLGQIQDIVSQCSPDALYLCDFTSDSSCFKDPFWSVFLIDMRDSCFVLQHLPSFEPDGNIKAVSGELLINVPPVFCKSSGSATDTLVYKVLVRDASGNYSNAVLTDPILIHCN